MLNERYKKGVQFPPSLPKHQKPGFSRVFLCPRIISFLLSILTSSLLRLSLYVSLCSNRSEGLIRGKLQGEKFGPQQARQPSPWAIEHGNRIALTTLPSKRRPNRLYSSPLLRYDHPVKHTPNSRPLLARQRHSEPDVPWRGYHGQSVDWRSATCGSA